MPYAPKSRASDIDCPLYANDECSDPPHDPCTFDTDCPGSDNLCVLEEYCKLRENSPGQYLAQTFFLRDALDCRSFHFGRLVNSLKDVRTGEPSRRLIPWSRIEIVNVLPTDFNYREAELSMDREGNILFKDRRHVCPIATPSESRH